MGKFCIKILIIGLILSITGTVILAVEYFNGYIDEMPSIPVRNHAYSTDYTAYEVTTMIETSPNEVIDQVTYSNYGYYENVIEINIEPDEEIKDIDVSIDMGKFDITPGASFMIYSNNSDVSAIKYSVSGGRLEVEYSPDIKLFDFNWLNEMSEILLVVPQKVYETISIDMDAGVANITGITANNFKLDMSAGESYISNVDVYNSSDIKMSAGYSQFISCGLFNSSKIEVSAGDMEFENSSVTGTSDIKVSAGALYMNLADEFSSYNISAEKSAGEVYINGEPTAKEYNAYATTPEPLGTINVKV